MNKAAFLQMLENRLSGLSKNDIAKSIDYYGEIIDDMTDEGMGEENAIASLPPIEEIVEQIMYEIPLPVLMKARMKPRKRTSPLQIILLILGFPLWFPLLITFVVVLLSFYIVIWSLIITLYIVDFCFVLSGIACILACPLILSSHFLSGLFLLGCGCICIGAGLFLFLPVKYLSQQLVRLTVWFGRKIKSYFIRGVYLNEQ